MSDDAIDRWLDEMPEAKIELIDGNLVVGNCAAGNLRLLLDLLEGWGAEAALPMAAPELWRQALRLAFHQLDTPNADKPLEVWQSWAAQVSYSPDLPPVGPMIDVKHRAARQHLMMSLFGLAREHGFAHVSGRDVIMRIGENAFTPDVFVVGPHSPGKLNEHYLDGPADLVIEVLLPGHGAQDREFKRDRYGRGGVPEYWLVDPARQTVDLLHWTAGEYSVHQPDADGIYRSLAFPGLGFSPDKLWAVDSWGDGPNPFQVEQAMPRVERGYAKGGVSWGDLPFKPRPGLEPRPTSFEEFAAWAPEAKFECIDGKPWIGGSRGSRNVLGMILRTAGLQEAVRVLHPRQWIAALLKAEKDRAEDSIRREQWWAAARRAASFLREQFGYGRLAVIGDLVRADPLNIWSSIDLVVFDQGDSRMSWDASHFLYEQLTDGPDVDLIDPERATLAEQQAIAAEAVEL
jgi:hypothetical protein